MCPQEYCWRDCILNLLNLSIIYNLLIHIMNKIWPLTRLNQRNLLFFIYLDLLMHFRKLSPIRFSCCPLYYSKPCSLLSLFKFLSINFLRHFPLRALKLESEFLGISLLWDLNWFLMSRNLASIASRLPVLCLVYFYNLMLIPVHFIVGVCSAHAVCISFASLQRIPPYSLCTLSTDPLRRRYVCIYDIHISISRFSALCSPSIT